MLYTYADLYLFKINMEQLPHLAVHASLGG